MERFLQDFGLERFSLKRSARVWFWKYWYNEYFPYSWKKAGIIVFIFDLLKGTLATLLPLIFHVHGVSPLIFGLLAVVGHTISVFDKFKGGKAVATSAGVVLGFNPVFLLYLAVVFFLVLYLFSMISLSSILGAIAALIGVLVFPYFHFILPDYDPLFSVIILALASIIIVRHKSNIKRIKIKKNLWYHSA